MSARERGRECARARRVGALRVYRGREFHSGPLAANIRKIKNSTLPADAERVFGDFAPRERRPSCTRTGAGPDGRAGSTALCSAAWGWPAPSASSVPHGRTALESRPWQRFQHLATFFNITQTPVLKTITPMGEFVLSNLQRLGTYASHPFLQRCLFGQTVECLKRLVRCDRIVPRQRCPERAGSAARAVPPVLQLHAFLRIKRSVGNGSQT